MGPQALLLTEDHFHVTLSLVHDVPHMFVLLLGRITTLIGEQDGALRLLCACSARMPAAAAAAHLRPTSRPQSATIAIIASWWAPRSRRWRHAVRVPRTV
eukprot:COSAG01_NODE_5899_length_3964_cov_3.056404_4_plen_100_part_00